MVMIMDYEDTKIEKKGNICCLIFGGIMLYCIIAFIIKYILGESNFKELFWSLLFIVPFFAIFISLPWINIRNSKRNRKVARNIREKGKKVTGIIKKIESTYKSDYKNSLFKRATFFRRKSIFLSGGVGGRREYYDYAVVEYEYGGENKIIKTPYVDFYKDDLTSKDVDVYIFDNQVYVDNFHIKREEIKRNYREWNNMQIKVSISFLIMFALVVVTVFLSINKIIPKGYISFIIGGMVLAYFILASIIYIKYIDDVFSKEDDEISVKFDKEKH